MGVEKADGDEVAGMDFGYALNLQPSVDFLHSSSSLAEVARKKMAPSRFSPLFSEF